MKILVIGSKGFIGSHAVSYFTNEHNIVVGCDIVNDYVDKNYLQIDATNSDFQSVFEEHTFDFCLNCSGAANVSLSLENPLKDFTLNTINVFKILDSIRKNQPSCKFINLSSAAVYGNPKSLPISELSDSNPVSPYGFHKKFSEEIMREFFDLYSIGSCSLRIFSAYGEGLKKQLLWDICQKVKTNKNIELFGTGKETRDFIHVEDIMQCIELVMHNSGFSANTYNIANGIQLSIKEIGSLLLKELDYKGDLIFSGSERKGDPIHWVADISKLKSYGYSQKVSIESGLAKYVKWQKELK